MSLIGKVETFNQGYDNHEEYYKMVKHYFITNEITGDAKQSATFLTEIGSSLVTPDKSATMKVKDLNKILIDHLLPKQIVIAERYKFHQRVQGEDEKVADFVAEPRRLSVHWEFDAFLNEALRDKLVCGLRDSGKRLLTERDLDLKTAISLAYQFRIQICNLKQVTLSRYVRMNREGSVIDAIRKRI